ncbi:hypothetical protein LCGC14_0762400 [marine sediment metagenome]|uniref:Uncharacterized protein n=1 Tax=marine sediment metagenome TaxID=412755 RepID=A0A0F9Q0W3_9ZZZZ
MFPSKTPMLIFSAIIGGCSMVGMVVLTFTGWALTRGEVNPAWIPKLLFGLFALGAAGSAGTLWLALKGIEKNVARKFGLDK